MLLIWRNSWLVASRLQIKEKKGGFQNDDQSDSNNLKNQINFS